MGLLCHIEFLQTGLDALEGMPGVTLTRKKNTFTFTVNGDDQGIVLTKFCVTSSARSVRFRADPASGRVTQTVNYLFKQFKAIVLTFPFENLAINA